MAEITAIVGERDLQLLLPADRAEAALRALHDLAARHALGAGPG